MNSTNVISIRDLEGLKGNINEIRANMLRIVFERDRLSFDDHRKTIDDLAYKGERLEMEYESIAEELDSDMSTEAVKTYDDFKNKRLSI